MSYSSNADEQAPSFSEALDHYQAALNRLKEKELSQITLDDRLTVLFARDQLESLLQEMRPQPAEVSRLLKLDQVCIDLRFTLHDDSFLDACYQQFAPPETAWWWRVEKDNLEKSKAPKIFNSLDWLWNLGSAVCLIFSTTFITQTAQAFSTEGFDVLGTISTITQGAGLAIVAKGTLTDDGRQGLDKFWDDLNVPRYLHQEATFGLALSLLLVSYTGYRNLHLFGSFYFHKGQNLEAQQQWLEAQESYIRSLNFQPGDPQTLFYLGGLYERLGDYTQANETYHQGVVGGDPQFFNALGRSKLQDALAKNSWRSPIDKSISSEVNSLLKRAEFHSSTSNSKELQIDILINSGVSQWSEIDLNRRRIDDATRRSLYQAERVFNKAFDLRNQLAAAGFMADTQRRYYDLSPQISFDFFDLGSLLYGEFATPPKPDPAPLDTTIYNWNELKAQCYHNTARFVNVATQVTDPEGRKAYLETLDPRLEYDTMLYSCYEMVRGSEGDIEAAIDSSIIEAILLSDQVAPWITDLDNGFPSLKDVNLDQAKQHQAALLAQLKEIQQKSEQRALAEPVIVRVLMNEKDQIVHLYTYDTDSLNTVSQTPLYELWQKQLDSINQEVIVADFWVRFNPSGVIEVQPWAERYGVGVMINQADQISQKAPGSLARSRPFDKFELSILRALVYFQLRQERPFLEQRVDRFETKQIYTVQVTADGHIVHSEPYNDEAKENLFLTTLSKFPNEKYVHNPAVAEFIVMFKSSEVFTLTPGQLIDPIIDQKTNH